MAALNCEINLQKMLLNHENCSNKEIQSSKIKCSFSNCLVSISFTEIFLAYGLGSSSGTPGVSWLLNRVPGVQTCG